jgi:hypothetical protein
MMLILSVIGYFDTSYKLDGNRLFIRAIRYEGSAIVTLKKTQDTDRRGNVLAYSGPVDVAVSPVVQTSEEEYSVFYHRVFFSLEPEEEYRFAVPFDSPQLAMVLQTERYTLKIVIKPE